MINVLRKYIRNLFNSQISQFVYLIVIHNQTEKIRKFMKIEYKLGEPEVKLKEIILNYFSEIKIEEHNKFKIKINREDKSFDYKSEDKFIFEKYDEIILSLYSN